MEDRFTVYSGACVAGPCAGNNMVFGRKERELYRYIPGRGAICIGSYKHNDYGQWYWWETEGGKAAAVLFGEPTAADWNW